LKITGIILRWIFILCLPILLLSASLAWGFNSLWLYEYGFQKYDVSRVTGLKQGELEQTATGLIDYFKINSPDEYIQINLVRNGQNFNLFTEEEQVHFKDVKDLVYLDYRILFVTLAFVLGFVAFSIFWRKGMYRRLLARSIIWGSGLAVLLILILGVASLTDFDQLFLKFHYLVFSNTNWSAAGYMLLLFPDGFWFDAALVCIGFTAGMAVILGAFSFLYLRLSKARKTSSHL
jgi:integral membrane protein (TIGR01906 family)